MDRVISILMRIGREVLIDKKTGMFSYMKLFGAMMFIPFFPYACYDLATAAYFYREPMLFQSLQHWLPAIISAITYIANKLGIDYQWMA